MSSTREIAQDDAMSPGWIAARLVIAASAAILIVVTALVVALGGSHKVFNAGVVLAIGLALLPAGVYAFGVRSQTSTVLGGAILLVVTGVAWGLYIFGHDKGADASAFLLPAFLITLVCSMFAAMRDGGLR